MHPETQINSWKIILEMISQQQTIKIFFLKN